LETYRLVFARITVQSLSECAASRRPLSINMALAYSWLTKPGDDTSVRFSFAFFGVGERNRDVKTKFGVSRTLIPPGDTVLLLVSLTPARRDEMGALCAANSALPY